MAGIFIRLIFSIIERIFRRGRGIFKFLFVIDDFFRIFTMTILIPIFFSLFSSNSVLTILGVLLGLVIDIQDFITEFGVGKF